MPRRQNGGERGGDCKEHARQSKRGECREILVARSREKDISVSEKAKEEQGKNSYLVIFTKQANLQFFSPDKQENGWQCRIKI